METRGEVGRKVPPDAEITEWIAVFGAGRERAHFFAASVALGKFLSF
jgi:hypothetical protein